MASSTKKNASNTSNTLINTKVNAETNIKTVKKTISSKVVAEVLVADKPAPKRVKKIAAIPPVAEVIKPTAKVNVEKVTVVKKSAKPTLTKIVAEAPVTTKPAPKRVKKAVITPSVVLSEVLVPIDMPTVIEAAVVTIPPALEPVIVNPVVSATKVTLNTIHTWPFPLGSRP